MNCVGVCLNVHTIVADGLLLYSSGYSPCGGFPEGVAPAFGGPFY